jgi:hypothetical protein
MSYELEITKTIYSSLRDEIIEKMRFSNQLAGYKLGSVGAIFGFIVINHGKTDTFFENSAIIVSLMLAIVFDLALYQNNKAIILVGQYIKENIEPSFKRIGENLIMWEEYITQQAQQQRRKIYNLFEIANYLMTLLLVILSILYFFNTNLSVLPVCFFCL